MYSLTNRKDKMGAGVNFAPNIFSETNLLIGWTSLVFK